MASLYRDGEELIYWQRDRGFCSSDPYRQTTCRMLDKQMQTPSEEEALRVLLAYSKPLNPKYTWEVK